MRYLKIYETFRQDFYQSIDDLETKYKSDRKKLFSDAKDKVDELMFDLVDDFSDEKANQQDFIEEDHRFSIWYHLKCDRKDFEDFIERLTDLRTRINKVLGLDIKLEVDAHFPKDSLSMSHTFNHGSLSDFDEMMEYIDGYGNMKPEYGLDQYAYFTFRIQIL
jgi:hypothetical protein